MQFAWRSAGRGKPRSRTVRTDRYLRHTTVSEQRASPAA
jgi:hypothetical protein